MFARRLTVCLVTVLFLSAFPFVAGGERNEALTKFSAWYFKALESAGMKKPDLFLGIPLDSNEAGIFADRDIAEDEELLRVPLNYMIFASRILDATVVGEILTEKVRSDLLINETDVMAFYLAFLKHCDPEDNPWKLYIEALPNKVDNIWFFNEPELKYFQGSSVGVRAQHKRAAAKTLIEDLQPLLKANAEKVCTFGWKEWKWAKAMVDSRSVALKNDEGNPFFAIVPFFDFFNHQNSNEDKLSWGYKASSKFFHAEALEAVKKGGEVLQFYGEFSNGELVERFGFFEEGNPRDLVFVDDLLLGVDPQDGLHTMKEQLLEEYRQKEDNLFYMKVSLSRDLQEVAQIINGGPEDFDDKDHLIPSHKSMITQLYSAGWHQAVLQHLLSQYPTTLEEDEQFIRTSIYSALSIRAQMAVQVVINEKKILLGMLRHFSQVELHLRQAAKPQAQDLHEEL